MFRLTVQRRIPTEVPDQPELRHSRGGSGPCHRQQPPPDRVGPGVAVEPALGPERHSRGDPARAGPDQRRRRRLGAQRGRPGGARDRPRLTSLPWRTLPPHRALEAAAMLGASPIAFVFQPIRRPVNQGFHSGRGRGLEACSPRCGWFSSFSNQNDPGSRLAGHSAHLH